MTIRSRGTKTIAHPEWYKDAIVYELHVRACNDSDGDGIGDFRGLADKLGYFADLGVTALWILPFYPSPLRDDGYDIADYTSVHPQYGTLADFKLFLDEAHRRGLKVITELVLNHTSSEHPWFQRARRAPAGSPYRDFYVWSDSPERYRDARIIFKDFETSNWSWDPVARAYYWHRFYAHQPDLNYDNPEVHKAMLEVVDFWLEMGVDGLRLDAVPYLYEREGTSCENLAETHAFLRKLRRHVDSKFEGRMLLGEANQWPEDAVAYFGNGDECHMAFHFPLMPRLFMSLQLEDRFPIVDIMEQTPSIPAPCQWALFLRNHDELTLEMVTDEDRDYMYRVYATNPKARINLGIRRRLAPLMGERRKVELMKALLLSLPGTPVLYYGDEIGMGDNIYLGDRNGVRTPMQWSSDRNAGFSRANPQSLYLPVVIDPEYHYEAVNIEAQQNNPDSLLWWHKRILTLRKRYRAFASGTLEFLHPDNNKILAYVRRSAEETILVVANMSRFAGVTELSLQEWRGLVPVELFGYMRFPAITEAPYTLALAPYGFYWFVLKQPQAMSDDRRTEAELPLFELEDGWRRLLLETGEGGLKRELEETLGRYVPCRRWFRSKARAVKRVSVGEVVSVPGAEDAVLAMVDVEYEERETERYLLPLAFITGETAKKVQSDHPYAVIARVHVLVVGGEGAALVAQEGMLVDGVYAPALQRALFASLAEGTSIGGRTGELLCGRFSGFPQSVASPDAVTATVSRAEQTNTSIIYKTDHGHDVILKLLRRVDAGVNPELDAGLFLWEKLRSPRVAPLAGALTYHTRRAEPVTLAVAHAFVPSQGDAWSYTLDALSRYFEWALSRPAEARHSLVAPSSITALAHDSMPPLAAEGIGAYLASAALLGQRTAELHLALTSDRDTSSFAPEPFTPHYQRSLYDLLRTRKQRSMQLLHARLPSLPASGRRLAEELLDHDKLLSDRLKLLLNRRVTAMRGRCHGDYHLGQVLFTGNDFVAIDFEGEPDRPASERRFKRCPLIDVAGMLRSFHYAAAFALRRQIREEDVAALRPWADFWRGWVSAAFLRAYEATAENAVYMPRTKEELALLLELYVLEKAIYEVGYELNNRPNWVDIPVAGLLQLLVAAHVSKQ